MKAKRVVVSFLTLFLGLGVGLSFYAVRAQEQPVRIGRASEISGGTKMPSHPSWLQKTTNAEPQLKKANKDHRAKLALAPKDGAKPQFSALEPIELELTIENTGNEPLQFGEYGWQLPCQFNVTDQYGIRMPLTRYGKPPVSGGSGGTDFIEPSHKRVIPLTLNRYVDMTVSGEYTVVVQKSFKVPAITVPSEPIRIRVVDSTTSMRRHHSAGELGYKSIPR